MSDEPVTELFDVTPSWRADHPQDRTEGRLSLVVASGDEPGRTFTLGPRETTLGRAVEAMVPLHAADVSRRHAVLLPTSDGGFLIRDLASRNGTQVNGVPIAEKRLQLGDRITLGKAVVLIYTRTDPQTDDLLAAERLETVGALAGGIAHDFNNLLAVLLANVSYLRGLAPATALGDPSVASALEDADTAGRRAQDLVRELLAFARRGKYEERPVHVSILILEVVRILERTVGPGISIEADVDPDLAVVGDRAQLHQALMSLCVYARDAMPEGGTLTLSARLTTASEFPATMQRRGVKSAVKLSVRDTGRGLDDESRRRLFEPFFSRQALGMGSGLGLAMVYGIIKNHGGEILAESTPRKGTAIHAYLPAASVHRQNPTPFAGERRVDAVRPRVLVVDDERLVRRGLIRLLEQLDCDPIEAAGGDEAIEIFKTRAKDVDLVILDLMMPKKDGEETFRELVQIDPSVRVLLSSGYSQDERARAILRAGARGFLQKPYDLASLRAALAGALDRPTESG